MTYAILGSGAIGTALARRFAAKGIEVSLANTKGPASLTDLVGELGSLVKPVTSAEALLADVVILAIPFDAVPEAVKGVEWGGRIVVDATNAIDFPAFTPRDLKGRLSTQIVAETVSGARVVKSLQHAVCGSPRRRAGSPWRPSRPLRLGRRRIGPHRCRRSDRAPWLRRRRSGRSRGRRSCAAVRRWSLRQGIRSDRMITTRRRQGLPANIF